MSKAWTVISGIQLLGNFQRFVVHDNKLCQERLCEYINCSVGYYVSALYSLPPKTLYGC